MEKQNNYNLDFLEDYETAEFTQNEMDLISLEEDKNPMAQMIEDELFEAEVNKVHFEDEPTFDDLYDDENARYWADYIQEMEFKRNYNPELFNCF